MKIEYIKHLAATCLIGCAICAATTACQDGDWDEPQFTDGAPFGNTSITETNLITIQELKSRYAEEVNTEGKNHKFSESLQIKGYVTGNDIQGNMYNEISIQDETGAIFIGITRGGLFGYLPIGAEIIVELKDLYIGNYRLSATIGTPYKDNSGTINVSRMPHALWEQHFALTGKSKIIEPELFADGNTDRNTKWDIATDAGKLAVIKNVSIKNGGYYNSDSQNYMSGIPFKPGESTYASYKDPSTKKSYSMSWYFNEMPDAQNGGIQIYNSSYADFAAMLLPEGKMNITGVVKRYREQWEFIIRSIEDVEEVK